jgi:hypothetical protein
MIAIKVPGGDRAMRRQLAVAKCARPSLESAKLRLVLLGWCRRSEAIAEKDLHPVDEFFFISWAQGYWHVPDIGNMGSVVM